MASKKRQKTDSMIEIKYWPLLARASGLLRMCAEAGVEFQHVSASGKDMGAALMGAESTNLAPPIVQDGNVIISQAIPCHQYIGEKLGFDKNIAVSQIALQYMVLSS